jgi:peptidoglycan/LPS O-acetylase OafA/YrhL
VPRFNFKVLQLPGLLVLAVLFSLADIFPVIAFAFPLVFALLILLARSDQGLIAGILNLKPFQILGQRSYSIYLMHMPLLLFFENIARRVDGPLLNIIVVLIYVTILILVSGWTYKYIENPFRVRFNQYASRSGNRERTGEFLTFKKRSDWLS